MTYNLNRYFPRHAADGVPGRDWFFPLSGWLLTALVGLEEDCPGTLLLHAFKSGALWRNSVAIALAAGALDCPRKFLVRANGEFDEDGALSARAQFAEAIKMMKPQQIVEASLSDVPPSLVGSLKKIGWEPLTTPEGYLRLIKLLRSTTSEGRVRRRVLEQVNGCRLTDDLLQVVECLDLAVLTPLTASHISTAAEAHRLNARLRVIRLMCSTATDAALKEAADAMGSQFNAGQFARSWLSKADRLEPLGLPIDNAPGVIRINPSTAEATGRRWRNCLAGYGPEMASGTTAFFSIEALSVIVLLRLTDAGWMLCGVYTHGNGRVTREALDAVKERLSGLGVLCIVPVRPQGDIALVAGAFSRVDDLEFEFEGMGLES